MSRPRSESNHKQHTQQPRHGLQPAHVSAFRPISQPRLRQQGKACTIANFLYRHHLLLASRSRHTSCILRPTPGEDARHHLPRSPRCAQPGHPSAPETGPPPTTTPPTRHPLDHMAEHRDPFWSTHPERVNPSPMKGESRAAGVIDSDRGCRGRRMKIGAESVPGCGAWDTSGGECS